MISLDAGVSPCVDGDMTKHYADFYQRVEHFAELAKEPGLKKSRVNALLACKKKLERQYFSDICYTGVPGLIDAQPVEKHPIGRYAVYFVLAPRCGRVKIGYSKSVMNRLFILRQGAPEKLVPLGWIPGGAAVEKELHKRLAPHRAHGEWFDLNEHVREELARFGIMIE